MLIKSEVQTYFPYGQIYLNNRLTRLWSQIAMWRRDYIISLASGYGELHLIEKKLFDITADFGNVFESFFGVEASNRIESYFTIQAALLNDIADSMKENNDEAMNRGTSSLYQNVEEMATYMSSINPYWDKVHLTSLLFDYYQQTLLQMVSILSGDQESSIQIYENLEDYVLQVAEYFSDGFIEYFV